MEGCELIIKICNRIEQLIIYNHSILLPNLSSKTPQAAINNK